jgi:hypothetical protein
MGKTVESYRMALEGEISRWNGFVRALRKDDREAFEEMKDMSRGYASEAGNAKEQPTSSKTHDSTKSLSTHSATGKRQWNTEEQKTYYM